MKKILSFALALLFLLGLCSPALALEPTGEELPLVIDETGLLLDDEALKYENRIFSAFAEELGIEFRVNIVDSLPEGMDAYEAADYYYDALQYGSGPDRNGLLLLLYVGINENDGAELYDWALYAGGENAEELEPAAESIRNSISYFLAEDVWSGNLETDSNILSIVLWEIESIINYSMDDSSESELPEPEPHPVMETGRFVADYMGLLSEDEVETLDTRAREISMAYGVGVYLVIVENSYDFIGEYDAYDAAVRFFDSNDMGLGESRNSVFLLMSMENRQMGLDVHGLFGNRCINEDQNLEIRNKIGHEYFGDDRWYDGFQGYLDEAERYISFMYNWEQDHPNLVDPNSGVSAYVPAKMKVLAVAIFIAAGLLVSGIVIGIMRRQLRSVYTGREADHYIQGGLNLHRQYDHYTHTTTSRTYSPRDTGSSGGGSSGGGGGGSSGGHSGGSSSF